MKKLERSLSPEGQTEFGHIFKALTPRIGDSRSLLTRRVNN